MSGVVDTYCDGFLNVISDDSEELYYQEINFSDKISRHKIGKVILKYFNVSV